MLREYLMSQEEVVEGEEEETPETVEDPQEPTEEGDLPKISLAIFTLLMMGCLLPLYLILSTLFLLLKTREKVNLFCMVKYSQIS